VIAHTIGHPMKPVRVFVQTIDRAVVAVPRKRAVRF
jgi:hypothetical protein